MRLLMLFISLAISSNGFSQIFEIKAGGYLKQYLRTPPHLSKIISLRVGTLVSPLSCSNKRTGTKDSEMGILTCSNLIITYDLGVMAGTHMHEGMKKDCKWYSDTIMNGKKIMIGLIKHDNKSELIITINGDRSKEIWSYPANFWTYINDENDLKNTLSIALSYTATKQSD